MNQTTRLIIVALALGLIAIMLLFIRPGSRPVGPGIIAVPSPGGTAADITPVPISPFPHTGGPITFTAAYQDPQQLPSSMPRYKTTFVSPEPGAAALASLLGFTGSPVIQQVGTMNAWEWNKADGSRVSAQTQPSSVSYFSPIEPPDNPPDSETAKTLVKNLLAQTRVVQAPFGLRDVESDYLRGVGPNLEVAPSRSQANITSVSLGYTIGGYPFLYPSSEPSAVSALVAQNNQLRTFSFKYPPSVEKTGDVPVVPAATAFAALQANKGVLAYARYARFGELTIDTPVISAVTIRSVVLGYTYSEANQTAEPVFIFTGIITKGDAQSEQSEVVFLVSAGTK